MRRFESYIPSQILRFQIPKHPWGFAKLVKAPDFDSGMRRFESYIPSQSGWESFWGLAKLVKAPDFDSGMRRFESYIPSQYKSV